jgi:hypothetical protein
MRPGSSLNGAASPVREVDLIERAQFGGALSDSPIRRGEWISAVVMTVPVNMLLNVFGGLDLKNWPQKGNPRLVASTRHE